ARLVWWATAGHGVVNSGRNVSTVRMESCRPSAMNCPRNSRVEASTQCRSSTMNRTGLRAARTCSHSSRARNVSSRCRTGDSASGGARARGGRDSTGAPTRPLPRRGHTVLPTAVQQPVKPPLRRLVVPEADPPLAKANDRVQPRVLVVRRAPPLDNRRVHLPLDQLTQDVLLQRVRQARLAQ